MLHCAKSLKRKYVFYTHSTFQCRLMCVGWHWSGRSQALDEVLRIQWHVPVLAEHKVWL